MVVWLTLAAFTLVSFAFGFGGIASRRIPVIGAGLLCLGYVVLGVYLWMWAAACPRCSDGGDLTRDDRLPIAAVMCGVVTAFLLSMMALGALVAWLARGMRPRREGGP